jgi:DNA-binding Lrp family transcriptional regulator
MLMSSLKLDRIDIRILGQLQKSGRIANVELADAVGLSPSPCLIRVKRLEKGGYVTGYGAHVAMEKLADVQVVFSQVTLRDRRLDFAKFEAELRKIDEIVECHLVSGSFHYMLKFVTNSVAHYQTIVEGLLEAHPEIDSYFSFVVMKPVFTKRHYPVEKLVSVAA